MFQKTRAKINQLEAERYRRYHEAKARIPLDLPPKEFEERVKKLAKRYHI